MKLFSLSALFIFSAAVLCNDLRADQKQELPSLDKQEKELKIVADSYLSKSLRMNPKNKSLQISKGFIGMKEQFGTDYFTKRYRILEKFKDEDVWIFRYINKNDDGSPKIGNGAGRAQIIINIKTKKVVGGWLMPK